MARNFIVIYLYNTFHSIIALFKDDVIQFCRNADVRLVRVTKSARNVFCIPTCHTIGADSEVASGPKADCPSRRCASCACFDLRRSSRAQLLTINRRDGDKQRIERWTRTADWRSSNQQNQHHRHPYTVVGCSHDLYTTIDKSPIYPLSSYLPFFPLSLAGIPFRYFPDHSGPFSLAIPAWIGCDQP